MILRMRGDVGDGLRIDGAFDARHIREALGEQEYAPADEVCARLGISRVTPWWKMKNFAPDSAR
jgi:transcriptional regulator with PAS, ATPase and Fis domain